jgi:hypothetical protein
MLAPLARSGRSSDKEAILLSVAWRSAHSAIDLVVRQRYVTVIREFQKPDECPEARRVPFFSVSLFLCSSKLNPCGFCTSWAVDVCQWRLAMSLYWHRRILFRRNRGTEERSSENDTFDRLDALVSRRPPVPSS